MPYSPVSNWLSATEDIRLQHRFLDVAMKLSRKTSFNKTEIQRLLQLHFILTTKRNRVMDAACFAEFMDTLLEYRNVDAVEKMHVVYCKENKRYLTGQEFVELLSVLLRGSLAATVKFCFDVYTEMVRSPMYIKKEDVLVMARKNNMRMSKTAYMEQYNRDYTEFVMSEMDKDRDTKISYSDYRKTVDEDIVWLQFLGPVLPTRDAIELFWRSFSTRPFVNKLEIVDDEIEIVNDGKPVANDIGSASVVSFSSDSSIETDSVIPNENEHGISDTTNVLF
ncbi:EF-hand calcium-binding domain-containing protein 1-like [Sipha flava]|uniref:EF-hand calcium-binding domain-containing protein 1 n=1 Tax=Sipha flava TaxID=143950 RepID=A0A2S2QML1_9HEMI|nr:EF-hand calcium-binding domain-containing protein 1-like [Sipha flava]